MKRYLTVWTVTIAFIVISLSACLNRDKEQKEADAKALTLMQTYCFACHTPELGIDKRLGPPMFKVREHYYNADISKQEFINKIVSFASNPTEANSIMPGAIRNFGLMPKQVFKKEDLEIIAGYIYDHDLSSDEWYATWEKFKTEANPGAKAMTFEEKGLNIVNSTKTYLVKNLMEAMTTYGTAGAVEFCNTHAMTLTDSMARVHNARIRRVSDRPRNPANQANETELAYINMLKIKAERQEALPPTIMVLDGKMTGYYPIQTAKMCIQCHGMEETDIMPETLAKIKSLYPDDKATGYAENQPRGLFVVEMD